MLKAKIYYQVKPKTLEELKHLIIDAYDHLTPVDFWDKVHSTPFLIFINFYVILIYIINVHNLFINFF